MSDIDLHNPIPDVHALFTYYNKKYFFNKLDSVSVRWSTRMTLCAGQCHYKQSKHDRRLRECEIALSEPLLKYRSSFDVIDTLLHEMIHAYLFMTRGITDENAHGPEFQKLMHKINKEEGTHISIYHTFFQEVDYYRVHWWQCNKCKKIVKRSMNRKPGPYDVWWDEHKNECGGEFIKIREPPKKKRKVEQLPTGVKPITQYFKKQNEEKKIPKEEKRLIEQLTDWKLPEKNNIKSEPPKKKDVPQKLGDYEHPIFGRIPLSFKPLIFPEVEKKEPETTSNELLDAFLPSSQRSQFSQRSQISRGSQKSQEFIRKPQSVEKNNPQSIIQKPKTLSDSKPKARLASQLQSECKVNKDTQVKPPKTQCPFCQRYISKTDLQQHLNECDIEVIEID